MTLGREQSGKVIEQSADDLLKIWRIARFGARREIFPGLLDGLMGAFLARSGRLLAEGGRPEEVWPGLVGIVRWSPHHGAQELTEEWAIAMHVLDAACEAFGTEASVVEWLARAIAEAEKGTAALRDQNPDRKRPKGVLPLVVFGDLRPQPRGPRRASDAD